MPPESTERHDESSDPYDTDDDPYSWASSFDDLLFFARGHPHRHSRRGRRWKRRRGARVGFFDWRGMLPEPPRQTRCPDQRAGAVGRKKSSGETYGYLFPCRHFYCECRLRHLLHWRAQLHEIVSSRRRVFVSRYRVSLEKKCDEHRSACKRISGNFRSRAGDDPRRWFFRFTINDGWEWVISSHDITGELEPSWGFWTSGTMAADLAWWLVDRFIHAKPQGSQKRFGAQWGPLDDPPIRLDPDKETIFNKLPRRRRQRDLVNEGVLARTGYQIGDSVPDEAVEDFSEALADEVDFVYAYGLGLDDR